MSGLLGNFFDKDNPVKRLEKEIRNTEFKKQSLIAPFQNEINSMLQRIDGVLYQIGKDTYECHQRGEEIGDRLTARFDEIASLKAQIAEKEAKIVEFANRYDEEIAILRANLSAMTQAPPPAHQGQPFFGRQDNAGAPSGQDGAQTGYCSGCGRPYAMGEDIFCMGCGQRLEQ